MLVILVVLVPFVVLSLFILVAPHALPEHLAPPPAPLVFLEQTKQREGRMHLRVLVKTLFGDLRPARWPGVSLRLERSLSMGMVKWGGGVAVRSQGPLCTCLGSTHASSRV